MKKFLLMLPFLFCVALLAQNVKTVDGVARANVKTVDGVAMASVKTIDGVDNAAGGGGGGTDLLTGLIAHWNLDEASDPRADSTAANQDLNATGDPVGSDTGKIGDAAYWDDALFNSGLESPFVSGLFNPGANSITISVWFKIEGTPNFPNVFLKPGLFTLTSDTSNKVVFKVSTGSPDAFNLATPEATVAADTWYHAVCYINRDTDKIGLIINDALIGEDDISADVATPGFDNGIRLGYFGGQPTFRGWIDECAAWSRPLTAGEITALYNGGSGLAYEDY
jgi:hypothetical protein